MKNLVKKILTLIISCFMVMNLPLVGFAATAKAGGGDAPSLQIQHSPIKSVKAGELIPVSAKINDREGIELVRIYFRSAGSEPYYFIPMIDSKNSEYYALLPAPSGTTEAIEYLFLVKTYNNRIFNSQTFTATIAKQKKVSPDAGQNSIDVLVETKSIPDKMTGFNEKTRVRLVTNDEKHGVLAGLYDIKETGGTASTGQYHGTIFSSKESNLNTMYIAGGVAVGVVAIALLAGSSGSGSDSSPPSGPIDPTLPTGAGLWTLEFDYPPCSKTTSQIVECSAEGLVTAVSPTAIGIPLPESCANSPFGGLADVFIVGGSCDTITACNGYSPPGLVSKTCADKSIIFQKQEGVRVERWSAQ